jgi:hypothetical protein
MHCSALFGHFNKVFIILSVEIIHEDTCRICLKYMWFWKLCSCRIESQYAACKEAVLQMTYLDIETYM